MPTSQPKVKQQAVSRELSEPLPTAETFEGMRGITSIAGDLGNQRVKGKVIIVTGMHNTTVAALSVLKSNTAFRGKL
ncbi:hypothetical protein ACJQWK_05131 [Exserohilum turcicum]